jgi:hypothetical protein
VYARHQNGLPIAEQDIESDVTDTVGHIARIGSMALVVFSCVTLGCSVLLPPLVKSPSSEQKPSNEEDAPSESRLAKLWRTTHISDLLARLSPLRPSLITTWCFAHGLFALAMFCAPFVHSVAGATFVVGLCGLPWAVTCWAPFALLGDEISKMGSAETGGYEMVQTQRSPPPSYDDIEPGEEHDSWGTASRHSEGSLDLEVLNGDQRSEEERILRINPRTSVMIPRPLPVH